MQLQQLNKLIRGPTADNNRILSETFADTIREARKKRYPSASDILDSLKDK